MKYSLRSLMIVVTLVCVVLGSVMGRVEYLRRLAVFHERKSEWHSSESCRAGLNDDAIALHRKGQKRHAWSGIQYRVAMRRPWAAFTETDPPASARAVYLLEEKLKASKGRWFP